MTAFSGSDQGKWAGLDAETLVGVRLSGRERSGRVKCLQPGPFCESQECAMMSAPGPCSRYMRAWGLHRAGRWSAFGRLAIRWGPLDPRLPVQCEFVGVRSSDPHGAMAKRMNALSSTDALTLPPGVGVFA